MPCRDAERLMSLRLDGQLSLVEMRHLDEHLASCQDCQQIWSGMRRASSELKQWPIVEPSADFTAKLMAQIRLQPVPDRVPAKTLLFPDWLKVVVILVVVSAAGALATFGLLAWLVASGPLAGLGTAPAFLGESLGNILGVAGAAMGNLWGIVVALFDSVDRLLLFLVGAGLSVAAALWLRLVLAHGSRAGRTEALGG
jgi:anti-sigma factor RsiW